MSRLALAALVVIVTSRSAAAQQRPLVTEDPETVDAGHVLIEAGNCGDQRPVRAERRSLEATTSA
jgi:hypothetical protein